MAPGKVALLLVLILLSATQPSLAQQSNDTSSHGSRTAGGFTPTTVVMLVVVVAALVLITLFSLYMNHCICTGANTLPLPRRPFHTTAPGNHCRRRGLDRELVEAFPMPVYGDVKLHMAPGTKPVVSLECAVCLAEFGDADELRVLPACCHVFHPGCIEPWLAGAVTCPLCRADLTAQSSDLTTPTGRQEGSGSESEYNHYRRTAMDRHTLRLPEHVVKELGAVRIHGPAASLAVEYPEEAVDQRTPGRLTSFLRSMSWQRHHRAESEADGGGSRRIYPVTGAPVETPSGSGSGGDEKKKESSDVDPLSRV